MNKKFTISHRDSLGIKSVKAFCIILFSIIFILTVAAEVSARPAPKAFQAW